jgi:hypothetical protein
MSTTVTHPQTSERTAAETYKAAVVQSFTEPLVVEDVPRRALEPGQVRVKSRPPASATPTSMPPTATGQSSPLPLSSPGTRESGSSPSWAPA